MSPDRIARRVALASIFIERGAGCRQDQRGPASWFYLGHLRRVRVGRRCLRLRIRPLRPYLAAKPPDEDHPYGHGRFETLTGLLVGILLSATGALISYRAIETYAPSHRPALFAVWPMFASIGIKSVTWWFKRSYGRRIRSESLIADSWNDAVDILSAFTALIALGITLSDPVRFAAADHIGGFAVGLIVVFLGLHVIRDTTLQLVDTMPPPALLAEIRDTALSVPGALGVEKCFARKTGLEVSCRPAPGGGSRDDGAGLASDRLPGEDQSDPRPGLGGGRARPCRTSRRIEREWRSQSALSVYPELTSLSVTM